jgi:HlyD family secretion protein
LTEKAWNYKRASFASINAIDEKTNSANPQIQVLQSQMNAQKANISVLQEQLSTALENETEFLIW